MIMQNRVRYIVAAKNLGTPVGNIAKIEINKTRKNIGYDLFLQKK
jgi:hypothetical protein